MKLISNGKMNKNASIIDPILTGAYILAIGMTILISLYIWVNFQEVMTISIAGQPIETFLVDIMNDLRTTFFYLDYLMPMLVGGLMIVSIILAYQTGASGISAAWALLVWSVAMLFSVLFSNVYESTGLEFPIVYAQLPILNFIMLNLEWITLFWLGIITLVMFRKTTAEEVTKNSYSAAGLLRQEGYR